MCGLMNYCTLLELWSRFVLPNLRGHLDLSFLAFLEMFCFPLFVDVAGFTAACFYVVRL
jgi:hypothetical protein